MVLVSILTRHGKRKAEVDADMKKSRESKRNSLIVWLQRVHDHKLAGIYGDIPIGRQLEKASDGILDYLGMGDGDMSVGVPKSDLEILATLQCDRSPFLSCDEAEPKYQPLCNSCLVRTWATAQLAKETTFAMRPKSPLRSRGINETRICVAKPRYK